MLWARAYRAIQSESLRVLPKGVRVGRSWRTWPALAWRARLPGPRGPPTCTPLRRVMTRPADRAERSRGTRAGDGAGGGQGVPTTNLAVGTCAPSPGGLSAAPVRPGAVRPLVSSALAPRQRVALTSEARAEPVWVSHLARRGGSRAASHVRESGHLPGAGRRGPFLSLLRSAPTRPLCLGPRGLRRLGCVHRDAHTAFPAPLQESVFPSGTVRVQSRTLAFVPQIPTRRARMFATGGAPLV